MALPGNNLYRTAMGDASGAPVTEPAPAKLNLYLHVTGRRTDGYHTLDSLVAFASVHDSVSATPVDDPSTLRLAVDGPFAGDVPADAGNLVLRAARALANSLKGPPFGAAITLVKRLPASSGIGGGSSDAAAALRALCRLWNARPPEEEMHRIAVGLGADVPVCLGGTTAYVGGIGEDIAPAPRLPACGVVLANPGVALPTPGVFAARQGPYSLPFRFEEVPADARALAALLEGRRNDLSDAAQRAAPVIGEALTMLGETRGIHLARMSGSGATCFGLYTDEDTAACAADDLRQRRDAWWIEAGRLLPGGVADLCGTA